MVRNVAYGTYTVGDAGIPVPASFCGQAGGVFLHRDVPSQAALHLDLIVSHRVMQVVHSRISNTRSCANISEDL